MDTSQILRKETRSKTPRGNLTHGSQVAVNRYQNQNLPHGDDCSIIKHFPRHMFKYLMGFACPRCPKALVDVSRYGLSTG